MVGISIKASNISEKHGGYTTNVGATTALSSSFDHGQFDFRGSQLQKRINRKVPSTPKKNTTFNSSDFGLFKPSKGDRSSIKQLYIPPPAAHLDILLPG